MFLKFSVCLILAMISTSSCFSLLTNRAHSSLRSQLRGQKLMAKAKGAPANPVAIVTGAGRGIGKAIALALGDAGCKVIINYIANESLALDVCNEIKARAGHLGAVGIPVKANCADPTEIKAMFAKVNAEVGPVDILVNNAGITRDMLTMVMGQKDFTDVIDVNLNGVFFCAQAAFTQSMMAQKRGRIVNIASIVGQIGNPGQANYAAAKGGVIGMTKALAKEFGGRNVCVNAVCPGFIESDMTKELNKDAIIANIPLRRFGTPEEVAGLVRFLATDPAAGYMTGHCFNVDGGLAIGAT